MSEREATIEIRAATVDDAADVHRLIRELAKTTGLGEKFRSTADNYRQYGFGETPLFEALIAVRNDDIVGVALYFYTFSSWRGEPGVYLQDLVVTEAVRGQRLGERLLRRLVRVAKEHHATHLRLAVDCNNEAAMRFYERCGMSNVESDYFYEIEDDGFIQLGARS